MKVAFCPIIRECKEGIREKNTFILVCGSARELESSTGSARVCSIPVHTKGSSLLCITMVQSSALVMRSGGPINVAMLL